MITAINKSDVEERNGGTLIQRLNCQPHNAGVAGSNPARFTKSAIFEEGKGSEYHSDPYCVQPF